MPQTADVVQLKQQTLQGFNVYIKDAEAAMERTSASAASFLRCDSSSEITQQVREGHIVAQFWSDRGPAKVPSGLIHDWIGAAFAPGVTVKETLALIQDYDHHANIFKPEVIASKLISRDGDDFQIYLRLHKKKIITVVLDTYHEVQYRCVDKTRWLCRSCTTRVCEVQDASTPKEKVLPPDAGYGFLWRLHSYWRFHKRDGGVYLECRAISLTRDVPFGMGWVIEPIIQKLPKESLIHTLECTRQALNSK